MVAHVPVVAGRVADHHPKVKARTRRPGFDWAARLRVGVGYTVRRKEERGCEMDLSTINYRAADGVARIELNRPERLNAINHELIADLRTAVSAANDDRTVRVMILSGAGRAFCAGYDLDWGTKAEDANQRAQGGQWDPVQDYIGMSRNVRTFMSLWESPKPVIAQVHGWCVGGGTDMALCSDLIYMAEDAQIGYPPARIWGEPTTVMWAYRLGLEHAKRLMLTGQSVAAWRRSGSGWRRRRCRRASWRALSTRWRGGWPRYR